MKNLSKKFAQLSAKYKPKCDATPGKWNSCEPCKNCGRRAKFPESDGTPPTPCCGLINPPLFWNDVTGRKQVYTSILTVPTLNCEVIGYFTPYLLIGNPNSYSLKIEINGSQTAIQNGSPHQVYLNTGDTIRFELDGLGTPTCFEIYFYNETCNYPSQLVLASICSNP